MRLIVALSFLLALSPMDVRSQSTCQDFIRTDISGSQQHLYAYLDSGYTVYIWLFATWNYIDWNIHEQGTFAQLYNEYGPNSEEDRIMVLAIETHGATDLADIYGTGDSTRGNWVANAPYPIIDDSTMFDIFQQDAWPKILKVCPNRTLTEVGQLPFNQFVQEADACTMYLSLDNINMTDSSLAESWENSIEPFKICADGSNSSLITFHCRSCDLSSIRFRMQSDPSMIQPQLSGGVSSSNAYLMNNDSIWAWFTHPSYVPAQYTPYRPDVIQIVDTSNGEILFENPVEYYRAPILFMHGLFGKPGTFSVMANNLIANHLYPGLTSADSPLIEKFDYYASNTASYNVNRYKVRDGIRKLVRRAVGQGYSCDRAISIGHSMGGILTRLYLQSSWPDVPYGGDLHEVITINTPHWGTQAADYGLSGIEQPWYVPFQLQTLMRLLSLGGNIATTNLDAYGAFQDLRVGSFATQHLLNGAIQPENVPSALLSTDAQNDNHASAQSLRIFMSYAYDSLNIFDGATHDLIVALPSQLSGTSFPPDTYDQAHIGSTDNPSVITHVRNLLSADPQGSEFTHTGFPQGTLTYPHLAPQEGSVSHFAFTQRTSDTLDILTPIEGQVYAPNDMVSLSFTTSSSLSRVTLFVSGHNIEPFALDSIVGTEIQFQVPEGALGRLNLDLLGSASMDWVAFDESYINVVSSIQPDSISSSTDTLHWALGVTEHVSISGYFGNAIGVNLIEAQGLSAVFDPVYLEGFPDGNYRGVTVGTTMLVFSYMGATDTVVVVVEDNPDALVASFDHTNERVCEGGTITFKDASQGLITGYDWSFPGGLPTTSTEAEPMVEYSTPGYYTVTLITHFINGSDTLVEEGAIEIVPLPLLGVNDMGGSLVADAVDVSYQWLDCGSGWQAIPGANAQEFTPTANGIYAVRVSNGACIDTSVCYAFIGTGLVDEGTEEGFRILPNPTDGRFNVLIPQLNGLITFVVRDIAGREIWSRSIINVRQLDLELTESPGLYFLDVYSELGRRTLKLMKR